ncbi:hypothetical protein GGE07_000524 [Sinorhizobium terangae]|uniref:Uncharacterized protein n=1 Tax=Sinorhizobium terangae TaxID=110322 RepID=A0A6N7LEC2_SINTE|nr:hypothetical protein [Sinorhizobium terangae]MBB4183911.1 hypothetical protein [Sinorhizobium terangae]MQX15064.1 hypothetical protein [Sinorhizobium terangae]
MTTILSLNPVYTEIDQRGQDVKLVLVNADEIIDTIVSPGHPKAASLWDDFTGMTNDLLGWNPTMTPEQAKLYALVGLIEKAYGIENGVPADETEAINEDEGDAFLEKAFEIAKKRLTNSKR